MTFILLQAAKNNEIQKQKHLKLKNVLTAFYDVIRFANPNIKMPDIDTFSGDGQKDNHHYSQCIF